MSNFLIGTSAGSLTDVATIAADSVAPISDFRPWSDTVDLGNALVRSLGRPIATWYWCWISTTQRSALMAYCPSKSARLFIRTEDDPNLHTSRVYEAVMVWPDTDRLWNQSEFRIEFRDLVEQTVT